MKQQEKIRFLLENGKNYPLSYWKEILFREKEEFWQEFEEELRIRRKNKKFKDEFRLTLKMVKDWKKEWTSKKDSEIESEVNNQEESMNKKEDIKIRKVKYKGELNLAGSKLPCYVLEDGTRVLSGRGMANALKMVDKDDKEKGSGVRLGQNLAQKSLQPFVEKVKRSGNFSPLVCYDKNKKIHGYEATMLPDICNIYLEARRNKHLPPRQRVIADQCEMLIGAFAKTGVIALIDETTGYQHERIKNSELKSQTQTEPITNFQGPFIYSVKNNTLTYQLTYQNKLFTLVWHSDIGGWWFSLKQEQTIIRLWIRLEDNYQITTHLKIIEGENETNYQAFFSYLKTD